jgi:hypothetical protein
MSFPDDASQLVTIACRIIVIDPTKFNAAAILKQQSKPRNQIVGHPWIKNRFSVLVLPLSLVRKYS